MSAKWYIEEGEPTHGEAGRVYESWYVRTRTRQYPVTLENKEAAEAVASVLNSEPIKLDR